MKDKIERMLIKDGFNETYIRAIKALLSSATDTFTTGEWVNSNLEPVKAKKYALKGLAGNEISVRTNNYIDWSKYGFEPTEIRGVLSGLRRFIKKNKIPYFYYFKPTPEEKRTIWPDWKMEDLIAWYFRYDIFKDWMIEDESYNCSYGMLLSEAKKKLKDAGYIVESRGKTNIEDFQKMKQDISELTHIAGSNFEFITTTFGNIYDDKLSQMILKPEPRKGYTYDTGKAGFARYKHLTRDEVLQIINKKEKEINNLGYTICIPNREQFIIYMNKTPLNDTEKEDGVCGYWSVGVGDGRWNYIAYGVRYRENGKEYPKNIKYIANRVGEQKFTNYFCIDSIKKYSTYNSLINSLKKSCDISKIRSEEKLNDDWDSYYIITEN